MSRDDEAVDPSLPEDPPAEPSMIAPPPVDESPVDEAPVDKPPRRRRWWWVGAAAAVVVLGGLYIGGHFYTADRLPAKASVAGVDIGGMSPSAAEKKLIEELEPRENQNLTLVLDDQEFTFAAADLGLQLDAAASVDAAGATNTWNPVDMFGVLFGGDDHRPEITVNEDLFESVRAAVAEGVDLPVTEALITFPEGQPVAVQPAEGRQVAPEKLLDAVRAEYLISDEPESIQIPVEVIEPGVDAAELERAMQEIAVPAVSAPIIIKVGDQQAELPVTAFTPALQIRTEGDAMVPYIDPEALAEPLTDSTTGIGEQAVDAVVDIVDGAPVITPSKPGIGLQPDQLATALVPVLTATGADRAVAVEAQAVEPEFTTADAEALKIVEKVSEFETHYPNTHYRNVNQGRAAELIDGTVLKPGEQFSFNKIVGERTAANGFVPGGVIEGGRFVDSYGGGVSQVATTTYNAAFFAGMDDDEHKPHSIYLTRYPVGREATVSWGTIDLKFTNSTPYGVLIKAWVVPSNSSRQGTMHVEMWSTKHWDIETSTSERYNYRSGTTIYDTSADCVSQSAIGGFDIDVNRVFKQNGQTVKTETKTANYRAADRVVCGPAPGSEPAPAPEAESTPAPTG